MNRLALHVIGGALAASIAAGCGGENSGGGIADGATHRVAKGPLEIAISETGTLKAQNSVNIKAKIPGSAKIVWLIPEGTEVKEGDKLAELDKTELQRNVDQLESQLVQLETERKSTKTEYEIEQAEGKAKVEKAELALEIKQKELSRYFDSDAPQEKRKKELAVEKAQSEFDRKQERYEQVQDLFEEGFVTASQVEEDRIGLRSAEIELQSAKDELQGYLDYTAEITRKQKESELAEARRNLDNERLRAENNLDRKRVAAEQKEQSYKATMERWTEQKEQLEAMTVTAPSPGIVIYQENGWNNEELKIGSTVYNEQPFLQLPDLSEMQVDLGIHEADINKMQKGQKVFVTVDSFPGEQLAGEITKVATIASERDWRSDVKKFEVVVKLDATELSLKPGMRAKVEVVVGQLDDVLTVPLQAVYTKEGKYFVFVADGGRPEQREVELGRASDNFAVVTTGLSEGDEVLLYNPETVDGASLGSGDKAPAEKKGGAAANGGGKSGGNGGGKGGASKP